MDVFLVIGVIGGIIVAVIAILLTNYNKKKDNPEKKESEKEKEPSKEAKSTEETLPKNKPSPQYNLSVPSPSRNPKTAATSSSSTKNSIVKQVSSAEKAETKNKVIAEEEKEEVGVSLDMEDYKHILTLFPAIKSAFSDLDKLVKEENFDEMLKNKELSKPVIEHIGEIKELYSEINKDAKELKKNTTDLVKTNKQLLLDAKKLVEMDDRKFGKYDKDLLEEAIKLSDGYETILNSSKKLEEGSANCINFCNNIVQLCRQILDDETNFAFNLAFGKKGAYEQLKKENESLLSLHYSAILTLKGIEQLLSRIKKIMKSQNAA